MASVASQLIEGVTAHAQSDSLEDARVICTDGTYFPNNLRIFRLMVFFFTNLLHTFFILIHLLHSSTCFEHYYANLQEDNCISTESGIVTLSG